MEAVAMDSLSADVFADVLRNGAKLVKGTGCMIVPETYAKVIDEITDWQVERIAAERLAVEHPKTYTEDEALKRLGITREEMEAAEDLEIELENHLS